MNDNNDAQLTINAIHPKHPITTDLNRRSWLHKENITESYRDIAELLVIGGVIWNNNITGDSFINKHGIKTPDASWKLTVLGTKLD